MIHVTPNHPLLALFVLWVVLAALGGCTTPAEDTPRQPPFGTTPDLTDPRFGVFVPERVDAVLGERLVIPVELAGDFRPDDVGLVRLDDGRRLATTLVWLRPRPARADRTWLSSAGRVEAVEPDDPEAGVGAGRWIIVLDPPIDAVGQGFWLAGRRVPVNWLPDPREIAGRVPSEAWSSPLPAGVRRSGSLQRFLDPLRAAPERRWRARLVAGELMPDPQRPIVETDGTLRRVDLDGADAPVFESEILDAVARFTEARLLVGLARLYEADSELNLAVRRSLSAVVDFGDGAIAPVWSTDRDATARLLDDLTDQTLAVRERARRAALWLAAQPEGVAWVLSDAGRRSIRGEPLTTVGLLNATWEPLLASLEPWSGASNLDLQPVPPLSVIAADVISRPSGASRAAVVATLGERDFQLLASGADGAAEPPGLRVSELFLDLTLDELLAQRRTPLRRDGTSALLYLDHRDMWVLYIECRTDGRTPGDADSLTISFGAVGSDSEAEVVASADGIVGLRDGSIAGSLTSPLEAEVGRYEGGWALRLTVPERFIEESRTLRFGMQRTDDRGVRSAWPRAMLPWQRTAPLAAVDLATWKD